jgi:hypothetical protein
VKIVLAIARDHYVRNLVEAGSFDALGDHEVVAVLSAEGVTDPEPVRRRFGRVLTVHEPPHRTVHLGRLQLLLAAGYRSRSRTMRHKFSLLPFSQRALYAVQALPGVRRLARRWHLRRAGANAELHELLARERPDLVILPSGGIDAMTTDAIASCRALGIRSLVLVHNWDNLSSKGAFAVAPDHLGVWGPQSVEHAVRIHGIPRERVRVLGAPSLDHYFRHEAGTTASRFGFPYVLFAGCFAPFDELTPLRALEAEIERQGLDLKVVYRPHPQRQPRRVDDRFRPEEFRHVVLDPELDELYARSFDPVRSTPRFPGLESYPATFEHARFVICPLSTMVVEAAIFEKPVIVVAYDDGIHPNSPAQVLHYDHFEGIDRVAGLELARSPEELVGLFAAMASREAAAPRADAPEIAWWLHHDDRTYAQRLAALVDELAAAGR